MTPGEFSTAGNTLINLTIVTGFLNTVLIGWGICETLYNAMSSRESTMVGRILRFWFRVKLAEPPECTCDCCTCAEDRRKGFFSPDYGRNSWFEIIPNICERDLEIEEDGSGESPAMRYVRNRAKGELTPSEALLGADHSILEDIEN